MKKYKQKEPSIIVEKAQDYAIKVIFGFLIYFFITAILLSANLVSFGGIVSIPEDYFIIPLMALLRFDIIAIAFLIISLVVGWVVVSRKK